MIGGLRYLFENWPEVAQLMLQHLLMSGGALLTSLVLAVPLGVWIARHPRLATATLSILSVIYTIPSLTLLILFVPFFGLTTANAVVVLILYAQVMLVRNVVIAMQGVDPAMSEAARGMGMNRWQRWHSVELPLALPVLLAGVRITLVTLIGITTIAALIGSGGLGQLLSRGLGLNRSGMIWAGALAVSLLAIGINSVLLLLERRWTPLARVQRAIEGRNGATNIPRTPPAP